MQLLLVIRPMNEDESSNELCMDREDDGRIEEGQALLRHIVH